MRNPPALRAVLALHTIDGMLHADEFELRIDINNHPPAAPDDVADEGYFEDCFEAYPWYLTYLKEKDEKAIWRGASNGFDAPMPSAYPSFSTAGFSVAIATLLGCSSACAGPAKAFVEAWNHAGLTNAFPNVEAGRHPLVRSVAQRNGQRNLR